MEQISKQVDGRTVYRPLALDELIEYWSDYTDGPGKFTCDALRELQTRRAAEQQPAPGLEDLGRPVGYAYHHTDTRGLVCISHFGERERLRASPPPGDTLVPVVVLRDDVYRRHLAVFVPELPTYMAPAWVARQESHFAILGKGKEKQENTAQAVRIIFVAAAKGLAKLASALEVKTGWLSREMGKETPLAEELKPLTYQTPPRPRFTGG